MRTCTVVPLLAVLLGGCTAPVEPQSPVPLTWSGTFGGGPSTAGRIMLLLDEAGSEWRGTMYFEADESDGSMPRATYRIEGTQDEGGIRVKQEEILEADPLSGGRRWCLGTYELALTEGAERSSMTGSYTDPTGACGGVPALRPADTL